MAGRFSRRTVIAAVDVLNARFSQARLSSYLIELGPEVYETVRGEEVSATKRTNDLKVFYDRNPDYVAGGGRLDDLIVEKAVSLLPSQDPDGMCGLSAPPADMESLLRLLSQDGYVVTEGELRRSLPVDIGLPATAPELVRLLEKHEMTVAMGHLDQAFDNHAQGNWAAANSQIRAFFDALLDDIAVRIDVSAATLESGFLRRTKLAKAGFLSRGLNEWRDDGRGYINGLADRLHPQGAHPGLSDEDDCTYRLHVVLLTAALFLRRFDQGRWK